MLGSQCRWVCAQYVHLCSHRERETGCSKLMKFLLFSLRRLPPPAGQCELAQNEKEKKAVKKSKRLSNHEKDYDVADSDIVDKVDVGH